MGQCPEKVCLCDVVVHFRALLRIPFRHGRAILYDFIDIGDDFIAVLPYISHGSGLLALVGDEIKLLPPVGSPGGDADEVSRHFRIEHHIAVIKLVCKPVGSRHGGVQCVDVRIERLYGCLAGLLHLQEMTGGEQRQGCQYDQYVLVCLHIQNLRKMLLENQNPTLTPMVNVLVLG